jgi:hypothetical protein
VRLTHSDISSLFSSQLQLNSLLEADIRDVEDIFTNAKSSSQLLISKRNPAPLVHSEEAEMTADEDKSINAWLEGLMKQNSKQELELEEPWEAVQKYNATTKPPLISKPSHHLEKERSEDSDPRVSAMAKLYERQMKARLEREKHILVEKERRQTTDMADCTFSPRINESSRRILAGSAPTWAASKVEKGSGQALFQALGWNAQLMSIQDHRKTPTKSSPHGKIAPMSSRPNRMDDFGERLYDQAMKLMELKRERARLQDQDDRQQMKFVARRYRSASPSPNRDVRASHVQDRTRLNHSPNSLFNQRMWLDRELLQPSDQPWKSLDWPEFVERQESFIRHREEKLRIEREQHYKLKPTLMSPGSQKIINYLRASSQFHQGMDKEVQESTFSQWTSLSTACSKSLPHSLNDEKKPPLLSSKQPKHPSSVSRILRSSARNKTFKEYRKDEKDASADQAGGKGAIKVDSEPLSFRPAITARAARRRPSSITELHDGGRSRREAWRQEQRLLREYDEAKELTLRPSISPSSYHKTSLIRHDPDAFVTMWRAKQAVLEERRKQALQEKEEEELKECTFKPAINQSLPFFVLSKPQRSLAEHSHYDTHSYTNRTSLILSLESGRTSTVDSRRISNTGNMCEESTNDYRVQDKEETLQKALELLSDVDAFLAKD